MNVSITERIDSLSRKNKVPAVEGSYDSVKEIRQCLNCPLPACVNCLDRRDGDTGPYNLPERTINLALRRAAKLNGGA